MHFLKKYKENHLYISLSKFWWFHLKYLRYRVKHAEIGNFRSFFPFIPKKSKKSRFWKIKKVAGDHHFTHVYQISQWYDILFLRYGMRQAKFYVIIDRFLLFYPHFTPHYPYGLRKLKFWRNVKTLEDIIIDGFSDIECSRQNVLWFWTVFCYFTSLTTQKKKIMKNWNKSLDISSFYTSVPKIIIIYYTVP